MSELTDSRSVLNEICALLDTYKGRDKVIRLLCYSSKLVGGLSNNEILAKRFHIFSSKMSATRTALRLLDDLPMLKYTLEYGLGKQEPDRFMASLGVVTNIVDQIYYPIEKMAWLAEHRLINEDGEKWDVASSVFWVTSIYLTLLKSFRYLNVLQKHKIRMNASNGHDESVEQIIGRQKIEVLSCVRLSLDLVHAVNTLPPGFFWSSMLQTWQVGLIGTISSVLGFVEIYAKRYYSS